MKLEMNKVMHQWTHGDEQGEGGIANSSGSIVLEHGAHVRICPIICDANAKRFICSCEKE
uniref:Uncharacterized protein n=1 Tax=Oryza barthii TaxID=65489 RepID=A0A0D3G6D6_9ORYZ